MTMAVGIIWSSSSLLRLKPVGDTGRDEGREEGREVGKLIVASYGDGSASGQVCCGGATVMPLLTLLLFLRILLREEGRDRGELLFVSVI